MKAELKKALEIARPNLRTVSPLAYSIILILGIFNLLLGGSLFLALDSHKFTASLLIVNNVFTYQFWGVVFVVLGLLKLYALYKNNWTLARQTLLIGVSVKAAWAVALTIRTFISPGTFFVDLTWVCLAAVQICCYVFFMPPAFASYKQRREDR